MSKQNLDINSIKSQSDENIKEAALNELKEIKKPINYENFKAYLQKKNDLSIVIKVNLDGKFKSITVPLVIYKTK